MVRRMPRRAASRIHGIEIEAAIDERGWRATSARSISAELREIRSALIETLRRREFELVLRERRAADGRFGREFETLQESFDRVCLDAANAMRRRSNQIVDPRVARDRLTKEQFDRLMNDGAFAERADEMRERMSADRKRLDDRLRDLAGELAPRRGSLRLLLARVRVASYSTQGHGARSYARNAACAEADRFRSAGVEAEVTFREPKKRPDPVNGSFGYVDMSGEFEVHGLLASELDGEIARRAPGLTLREHVRQCWARGVNPRVDMPFLPHGYEEREGLDFFGNDLRAGKESR